MQQASSQNPTPFAASPSVIRRSSAQPRFGGVNIWNVFKGNSVEQFISDTAGVWAPKVPLTRSKTQFFEDAFLELVEDFAFYFTVPFVGPLLSLGISKMLSKNGSFNSNPGLQALTRKLKLSENAELLGMPLRDLVKETAKLGKQDAYALLKPVIATKAGALLGAVGVAAGFEYMIQHTKNVITALGFKTKNFAAVAGLENANSQAQQGEQDPVRKAKKRGLAVLGLVTAATVGAFAAPQLLMREGKQAVSGALRKTGKFLEYFDFAKGFDLSKPVLAFLIATGIVSYMDAARDSLERKETGLRLAVVAPYLMWGKDLAGAAIAWISGHLIKIDVGDNRTERLNRFVRLGTGENPFRQLLRFDKHSLLSANVIKETIYDEIHGKLTGDQAAASQKVAAKINALPAGLVSKARETIIGAHKSINIWSYIASALVAGIGINALAYDQTRRRHKRENAASSATSTGQRTLPAMNNHYLLPGVNAALGAPQAAPAALKFQQRPAYPANGVFNRPIQPYPAFNRTGMAGPGA